MEAGVFAAIAVGAVLIFGGIHVVHGVKHVAHGVSNKIHHRKTICTVITVDPPQQTCKDVPK